MSIKNVFNTFSTRTEITGKRKELTTEFKYRVIMLCADSHHIEPVLGSPPPFWIKMHKKLTILMGTPILSDGHHSSHFREIEEFLHTCSDDNFLDFIEFVFKIQPARPPESSAKNYVSPSDINTFFDIDDLPYQITDYVFHYNRRTGALRNQRSPTPTIPYRQLIAIPKVIVRDSQVLHQTAIKPTLELLQGQHWRSPNEEFEKALQHYRKREFGDCVAMCGSSLESVMKIICKRKNWENKPDNMDAGKLLDTIVSNSNLDPFYKKLLELTHVIRNAKSTAHGAGNQTRTVPPHIAQFTLNMTASTILLLTEETKPFS